MRDAQQQNADPPVAAPLRRPRNANIQDRLLRLAPEALSDAELLSLFLRSTAGVSAAQHLLDAAGGIKPLLTQHALKLRRLPGLSPQRAATLLAAVELGRRTLRATETRPCLPTASAVHAYLAPTLLALRREVFHVLCLNRRHTLLADVRVAEGSTDNCPLDPREVFSAALVAGASAIILAHNHPSGEPRPSSEDIALTKTLIEAGRLLSIPVVDHIIIADGRYTSMWELGHVPKSSRRHKDASSR